MSGHMRDSCDTMQLFGVRAYMIKIQSVSACVSTHMQICTFVGLCLSVTVSACDICLVVRLPLRGTQLLPMQTAPLQCVVMLYE